MLKLFRIIAGQNPKALKPKAPRQEPLDIFVSHLGIDFRVQVKRSPKAKRYTLRIRAASQDLILSIPERGSIRAATEFARRHSAWIHERMTKLPKNTPFLEGSVVPFKGVEHIILKADCVRGATKSVCIDGAWYLVVHGDTAHISRRITDFLRKEARADLVAAVQRHTSFLGVAARRVTLKDTTSRWGSCSSTGALNFSWRLVMAPPFVLEYLAAHEVAHLKHLDHSTAFWDLTRQLDPNMDNAEAWLKKFGHILHRYGKTN